MPYRLIIGDITDLSFHVDVIVTLAHPTPGEVGNGVDRGIYNKVGDQLKDDRRRLGPFSRGEIIMTSAYNLNAERLIHVLGPYYRNGEHGESAVLRKCYDRALEMAYDNGYRSIAFPLMSSGNHGFSIPTAYRIAMESFLYFCEEHSDMDVYLVLFDKDTIKYCRSQHMYIRVDTPIKALRERETAEYPVTRNETYQRIRKSNEVQNAAEEQIDDIFHKDADIFDLLCRLMDHTTERFGMSERSVCESVALTPTDFSNHIRNSRKSVPSKQRLLAYSIAFRLNPDKTDQLLNRAGYALHRGILSDLIVTKHIESGIYDIHSINTELEKNGLPPLSPKTRISKKKEKKCHKTCDNKSVNNSDNMGVHKTTPIGE